jgi:multidrug efflux pump subunit AcrB
MTYIKAAVSSARTTLSIFVVIILAGIAAYRSIPVELNPDVTVPVIITTIVLPGISPEDAERLLARPSEIELTISTVSPSYAHSPAKARLPSLPSSMSVSTPTWL